MKYNPSEAYALAIGHLADRMRGGGAFVQAWPRDERVLSRAERYEMQQLLAARGFDIGAAGRQARRQDAGCDPAVPGLGGRAARRLRLQHGAEPPRAR